jgi:hypothetical protein
VVAAYSGRAEREFEKDAEKMIKNGWHIEGYHALNNVNWSKNSF